MPARAIQKVMIDSASTRTLIISSVCYFFVFFIFVIVGVVGPRALTINTIATGPLACFYQPCYDPSYYGTTSNIGPLNQFLALTASLNRPLDSNGLPVLLSSAMSFYQVYVLDIQVLNTPGAPPLVFNATHGVQVHCPAGQAACDGFLVFFETSLPAASDFGINIAFKDLLKPWSLPPSASMSASLTATFVPGDYTTFQMGWRYFFVATSFLSPIVYGLTLAYGPGARDERSNECFRPTIEQAWALALGILAFFFNDPTIAATIYAPSFSATAFAGVSTVTFLTALLTYWLVHFHVAALQGEGGAGWEMDASKLSGLSLLSFWAPKIVFATAFWIVSLSAYLWTRYIQYTDPAYSLFETMPAIGSYFFAFMYALMGFFLLYAFALLVRGCRTWSRMRPGNRLFIALTLLTLLVVAIGVYVDLFSSYRTTSASFLVVYGAANLYVWFLMLAYLPERRVTMGETIDEQAAAPTAMRQDGQMEVDAGAIMAASGTEDTDVSIASVQIGDEHEAEAQNGGSGAATGKRKGAAAVVGVVGGGGGDEGQADESAAAEAASAQAPPQTKKGTAAAASAASAGGGGGGRRKPAKAGQNAEIVQVAAAAAAPTAATPPHDAFAVEDDDDDITLAAATQQRKV